MRKIVKDLAQLIRFRLFGNDFVFSPVKIPGGKFLEKGRKLNSAYSENHLPKGSVMFNRSLQVKMVKNEKTPVESYQAEARFEDKFAVISKTFEKAMKSIGKAVICYVVVDTARQVVIANATKS